MSYFPPKARVYRALLDQTGTSAPTASVLENTLGFTPSWVYDDVGSYHCENPAAPGDTSTFPINKTFFVITPAPQSLSRGCDTNLQSIEVFTTDNAGTPEDELLSQTAFEILIYP